MLRIHVTAAALTVLVCVVGSPASATEGGTGAYLLGSRDSLAGIVPPPGTYISADVFHLDGKTDFVAAGGAVLTDVKANLWITKLNATHSFKGSIVGGRPAITVTLPVVTGELLFNGSLGLGGDGRKLKDDDTGLGDLIVTPSLGWDQGNNHYALSMSVFLPTGFYEPTSIDVPGREVQALSFGKNRVAVTPTVAWTNLNPKTGLEFSAAANITFSAENSETNYQTAPEFVTEVAALQHLKSGWAFGLQGYAYQQLGDDSGTGADDFKRVVGAQSLEARVFGVGPLVTYSRKVGSHSVSGKFKYIHEFGAKRRLESDVFVLNLAIGF